jgi:PTS system nitrogen regulatory IIA component
VKLVELVKSECVAAGLALSSKDACLRKIAQLAKQSPQLRDIDEADILSGLQRREEMGSTGFGKGIAIPHCRLSGVKEFVVGIISVPEGVEFDTLDNEKAHLIVFIVAPESEANEHVSILSAISRTLRLAEACSEMQNATTSELLLESFLRYQRDDATAVGSRHLFHITILNDDKFRDILQLLTAMEPASLAIIEATQASQYLAKMPLFAGFWNDREMDTGRVIIAQIDKRLTNETIRSIEDVVGKLDDSTEVSVCIQDIFFSAGRLNA